MAVERPERLYPKLYLRGWREKVGRYVQKEKGMQRRLVPILDRRAEESSRDAKRVEI